MFRKVSARPTSGSKPSQKKQKKFLSKAQPNDWLCPTCNRVIFAAQDCCPKCNKSAPHLMDDVASESLVKCVEELDSKSDTTASLSCCGSAAAVPDAEQKNAKREQRNEVMQRECRRAALMFATNPKARERAWRGTKSKTDTMLPLGLSVNLIETFLMPFLTLKDIDVLVQTFAAIQDLTVPHNDEFWRGYFNRCHLASDPRYKRGRQRQVAALRSPRPFDWVMYTVQDVAGRNAEIADRTSEDSKKINETYRSVLLLHTQTPATAKALPVQQRLCGHECIRLMVPETVVCAACKVSTVATEERIEAAQAYMRESERNRSLTLHYCTYRRR